MNTEIWLRIFVSNMPQIFEYLELDDFQYGLPYINIAVAESAVCPARLCLLPVCALVKVLPHNLPLLKPPKRQLPFSPLAITHCAAAGTCKVENIEKRIAIDSSRCEALLLTC